MITINQDTRQLNIPGDDLVFGVEFDAGSERKYFQCPRYVGDNLDFASCFVRINIRNANGDLDSYLVDDVTVDGDNVVFSWVLSEKAVKFKGQLKFVVCAVGPNHKVEWHTTLGTGMVLEGLEPEIGTVEAETSDVVAQLIAMVEMQTEAVKAEGAAQVKAVQAAAKTAEMVSVAEIDAKGVNTLASIPEDYTALQGTVDVLARTVAPGIVCETAGSVVAVNDSSDKHIQGLRIFGRSTQDGTPTPEAPVEIASVETPVVTVCGKNLLNLPQTIEKPVSGYNYDLFTQTAGQSTAVPLENIASLPHVEAGKSYYFSYKLPANAAAVEVKVIAVNTDGTIGDANGASSAILAVNTSAFTPTKSSYVTVRIGNADATTFYDMQLELGGVATDYEPYSGQTVETTHTLPGIPVTSGGNYTDSDGQQWICDEVDLERGVYVQRIAIEELSKAADYNAYGLYCTLFKGRSKYDTRYLCSHTNTDVAFVNGQTGAYVSCVISKKALPGTVVDVQTGQMWIDGQKTAGTPVTVTYALTTPIETPLSETEIAAYRALHSNYPHTTVLTDSGAHLVVKYVADTKLYIDNKIKEALQ